MRNAKISKVLVIGLGSIIIGQAAGFDYSGAQARFARMPWRKSAP